MVHVADVMKSVEFYRLLGFEIGNAEPRSGPPYGWVWLYQPKAPDWKTGANLMLTSGKPPAAKEHSVLFYLYVRNLKALREDLLAQGMKAGEISYPFYLPEGEFELHDPDGYTLMMAQSIQGSP